MFFETIYPAYAKDKADDKGKIVAYFSIKNKDHHPMPKYAKHKGENLHCKNNKVKHNRRNQSSPRKNIHTFFSM